MDFSHIDSAFLLKIITDDKICVTQIKQQSQVESLHCLSTKSTHQVRSANRIRLAKFKEVVYHSFEKERGDLVHVKCDTKERPTFKRVAQDEDLNGDNRYI